MGLRLIVFGEEPTVAYDRIRLTAVFKGTAPEELRLATPKWYLERGIELRLGDPVVSVDVEAKHVTSAAGLVVDYDDLVFATGAEPRVPPVEGLADPGVLLYRNLADAARIRDAAQGAFSAVVMGGGLLGLEAAAALKDLGLKVCVIEAAAFLMPRQLDPDGGAQLLSALTAQGLEVFLGRRAQAVRRAGQRWVLSFENGDALQTDVLVLAAGVRPRDELARLAGLRCAATGGVIIDERLQSSAPGVYAIGDCALFKGTASGLVAPGYEMAEVLAACLLNRPRTYVPRPISTRLKVVGIDVSVLGDVASSTAHPVVCRTEAGYRKLLVQKGTIVGAAAVGPWPERDRIERAITDKRTLWRWTLRRFPREGSLWPGQAEEPVASWPDSATVCHCVGVSCGRLRELVASGCQSVHALGQRCAAGTVCGSCKPQLEEMLGVPVSLERVVARGLLRASLLAGLVFALHTLMAPIPLANTVEGHEWEALWRQSTARQITGFSLLGVAALAASLSLRKRWFRRWGAFESWRVAHAILGVVCLVGLMAHTGFSRGQNFNAFLYWDFLLINLMGAGAGAALSLRPRTRRQSLWQRRLRWLHVAVFAPLPLLIAFHILAAYWY